MKKRLIFDLIFLAVIFYLPWWVVVIVGSAFAFIFAPYYEVIGFGVIVDILYGANSIFLSGIFGLLASIIIFYAGAFARKAVR